jgi:hypothetical protein
MHSFGPSNGSAAKLHNLHGESGGLTEAIFTCEGFAGSDKNRQPALGQRMAKL